MSEKLPMFRFDGYSACYIKIEKPRSKRKVRLKEVRLKFRGSRPPAFYTTIIGADESTKGEVLREFDALVVI